MARITLPTKVIEVRCHPSGDVAYADDPEAAVVAARALCADDAAAVPILGRKRRASFWVDGVRIADVPESELWKRLLGR